MYRRSDIDAEAMLLAKNPSTVETWMHHCYLADGSVWQHDKWGRWVKLDYTSPVFLSISGGYTPKIGGEVEHVG